MLETASLPSTTPPEPNGKKGTSSLATQLQITSAIPENEFIPNLNTCHGEIWIDSNSISGSSFLIFNDGNKVPQREVISEDACKKFKGDGFIGLRPLFETQQFLRKVLELIGDEEVVKEVLGLKLGNSSPLDLEDEKKLLKRLFSEIIWRSGDVIAEQCKKLAMRLDEHGYTRDKYTALGKVIRKCLNDCLDDKGVFVAGSLVSLKYEGAVVRVRGIHAYGEGDIIGYMAWSNDILAYGFQPSEACFSPEAFISSTASHTHSDCDLLPTPPSPVLLSELWGWSTEGKTTPHPVPLEEFELIHIVLNHQGDFEETIPFPGPINGPLVFIIVKGKAEIRSRDGKENMVMERGDVVFVRPDVVWRITAMAKQGADIWGAYEEEPTQTADHVVLSRAYLHITIKHCN